MVQNLRGAGGTIFEKSWNASLVEHCLESYLNTLTANYEYSRSNRKNLPLPIQIKLSKKPYIFLLHFFFFFFCIFEIYIIFPMLWKKDKPHRSSISEVIDSERCAYLNA